MADRLKRIAVVKEHLCKPDKCSLECKGKCPVVNTGKCCVEVSPASKSSIISEDLCVGCATCVKKCPFGAIEMVNLPTDVDKDTSHRYGANGFKLHRLPVPKPGMVLGLVGRNCIGKTTVLKILAGKLKPNLGRYNDPPGWHEIVTHFSGSGLQSYFTRVVEEKLKIAMKPQHVYQIKNIVEDSVRKVLEMQDERGMMAQICEDMELQQVLDSKVSDLSGGELQRFAIAAVLMKKADVYVFDEPSSFLDVRQRLRAAQVIRSHLRPDSYVIVADHDLGLLEFISDIFSCMYGTPTAYGVVSLPFAVRQGINVFLSGFIPAENLRFRDKSLTFKVCETPDEIHGKAKSYSYPAMSKTRGRFKLHVCAGEFAESEIVLLLGGNGTGKTTFIRMLAHDLLPDPVPGTVDVMEPECGTVGVVEPECVVSYKPQRYGFREDERTVRQLLRDACESPQFVSDVVGPLEIEQLMDKVVGTLSGGEMQRVEIAQCLGQPADLYLLDEPSAELDCEQRLEAARVIKSFVRREGKAAVIADHEFVTATYLADHVVVFAGQPSVECTAHPPETVVNGVNRFLHTLSMTFRMHPKYWRPMLNRVGSAKDVQQKADGKFCV